MVMFEGGMLSSFSQKTALSGSDVQTSGQEDSICKFK